MNLVDRTLQVAHRAGGRNGHALKLAVSLAQGGPALGTRTTRPVSGQIASVLGGLGLYNPQNVPTQIKKRMRKDPQIRLALEASKAPILKAPLWFESSSTELVALLTSLFLDSGLLHRALRTALLAVEFGFSTHETVWQLAENHEVAWDVPVPDGGFERRTKSYPSLFVVEQFKDLDPSLVTLLVGEKGDLEGMVYGAVSLDGSDQRLPVEKLFHFALNDEWQNPYGEGALEWAYDPWYWQQIIYLITNRWFERKADPPLVGRAPTNPALAQPTDPVTGEYDDDEEFDSPLLLHARGMRMLKSTGYYVMPSEPYLDENGRPSNTPLYDLKELEVADMSEVFLLYLDHLDRKKARAVLVPDSVIAAQAGAGTYGSLQVLADIAVDIQNVRLSQFVDRFNAQVVKSFLAYNGMKERVVLRTGGISATNRQVLAQMAMKVMEADMLAEQAWGRIFPSSMTSMVSRDDLLRAINVPFKQPDPDAPLPEPPMEVKQVASGAEETEGSGFQRSKGFRPRRGTGGGSLAYELALKPQTLVFAKERFPDAQAAKAWATGHGFLAEKVDETTSAFRLRQRDPSSFFKGTFRTISLAEGVQAVVADLKDGQAEPMDRHEFSSPQPQIHLHLPQSPAPSVELTVPVPEVTIQPPNVDVKVEAPTVNVEPPHVNVQPPSVNVQPPDVTIEPPIVNVHPADVTFPPPPDVVVKAPEPRPYDVELERDATGRIKSLKLKPR